MRERPIIFSAPMVKAILAGRKTQTRRIIKGSPVSILPFIGYDDEPTWEYGFCKTHERVINHHVFCPYGQPSDRLWVRENFRGSAGYDGIKPSLWGNKPIWYCADGEPDDRFGFLSKKIKPSIHMPRHISRINLEIKNIRVERLNDISQADAIAEGAPESHPSIDKISREYGYADFSRSWFAQLWETINGTGAWKANPWVWIVDFNQIKC